MTKAIVSPAKLRRQCVRTTAASSLVMLLLGVESSFAQQPSPMPAGTGSISGRVTADDTGKPISGATVQIAIYENISGRFPQVTTDAQGKFEFTGLPAGHFQIAAQATRYLRMQYGQQAPGPAGLLNPARIIELQPGQAFTTANFSLSRFCAIEGVIVDEYGDPLPNVAVQAAQVQYAAGRRRMLPANPSLDVGPPRVTNDQGRFRIAGLAPGEYYVEALSGAFADPNAAGGFAITFFPGTTRPANAQAVTVRPGHDALDVSFALTAAPMSRVAGTLVDSADRPFQGGSLILVPSERTGPSVFMMVRGSSGQGGRFTFRNVPPGTYTIQAFGAPVGGGGNLGAAAFGYLTFTVEGHDLDDLIVKVPAPRNLRGHITFEGDTSTLPKPADVFISPRQVDFESAPVGGGPAPMVVRADWTFEVNAMSGLRLITVANPQGWTMKRATLNGRDVTDTPLDLREHDINDLEIVLSLRTTKLAGTVTGGDGQPVSDFNVVVFADDETKWTPLSRYVTFVRPGSQGAFTATGLPEGSYVAVALGAIANGEWQDPEFLRQLRPNANAAHFTLNDGLTTTVALRIGR